MEKWLTACTDGGMTTRVSKWVVLAGILALVVALLWVGPYFRSRRGSGLSVRGDHPNAQETSGVGTTGRDEHVAPLTNSDATLHDLETMLGLNDENQLIGRRVDFHVRAGDMNNYGAMWIGNGSNRALVVLARDNRTTEQRDRGAASANNIQPVKAGQMAHITGTIERIPKDDEARFSWGLAGSQHQANTDLKVYIRADNVTPEG